MLDEAACGGQVAYGDGVGGQQGQGRRRVAREDVAERGLRNDLHSAVSQHEHVFGAVDPHVGVQEAGVALLVLVDFVVGHDHQHAVQADGAVGVVEVAGLMDVLRGVVLGGLERSFGGVSRVDADAVGAYRAGALGGGDLAFQRADAGGGQAGGVQPVGGGLDVA
ncbi:hypothetical protein GCM10020001_114670 [Nonomuraea salmonea]